MACAVQINVIFRLNEGYTRFVERKIVSRLHCEDVNTSGDESKSIIKENGEEDVNANDNKSDIEMKENGEEISKQANNSVQKARMQYVHFLGGTGLKELRYSVGSA